MYTEGATFFRRSIVHDFNDNINTDLTRLLNSNNIDLERIADRTYVYIVLLARRYWQRRFVRFTDLNVNFERLFHNVRLHVRGPYFVCMKIKELSVTWYKNFVNIFMYKIFSFKIKS